MYYTWDATMSLAYRNNSGKIDVQPIELDDFTQSHKAILIKKRHKQILSVDEENKFKNALNIQKSTKAKVNNTTQ